MWSCREKLGGTFGENEHLGRFKDAFALCMYIVHAHISYEYTVICVAVAFAPRIVNVETRECLSVLFSNIFCELRLAKLAGLQTAPIPLFLPLSSGFIQMKNYLALYKGARDSNSEPWPVPCSPNHPSCSGERILETPSPGLDPSLACVSSDLLARVRNRFHQEDWTKIFCCGAWN